MSDPIEGEHSEEVAETSPEIMDVDQKEDLESTDEVKTVEKEESDEEVAEEKTSQNDDTLENSSTLNVSSVKSSEDSMEESIEEEKADVTPNDDSVLSAKRNRKKVERFVQEFQSKVKEEEVVEVKGDGVQLRDIPFIEAMITKTPGDDLRGLHRLLFNRQGASFEVKRNIRKFNGFSMKTDKDNKEYERKQKKLEKLTTADLKKMLTVLGLEKKGMKNEIVERVLEFIRCPVDKGHKLPVKKGKGKTSKTKKEKGSKKNEVKDKDSKKNKVKAKKNSLKTKKVEAIADSDDDDTSSEEEMQPIKKETPKKKKKVVAKPASDSDDDTSSEEEAEPVKKQTSSKKKKVESKTLSDSDNESSSEEEPIKKKIEKQKKTPTKKRKADEEVSKTAAAKKKKDNAPTDAQIQALLKKILGKANLEEVTMKKVCQQVYDKYPNHNLLPRKEFIKETVKSMLS